MQNKIEVVELIRNDNDKFAIYTNASPLANPSKIMRAWRTPNGIVVETSSCKKQEFSNMREAFGSIKKEYTKGGIKLSKNKVFLLNVYGHGETKISEYFITNDNKAFEMLNKKYGEIKVGTQKHISSYIKPEYVDISGKDSQAYGKVSTLKMERSCVKGQTTLLDFSK